MRMASVWQAGLAAVALSHAAGVWAENDPLLPVLHEYLTQQMTDQGIDGQADISPTNIVMPACQAPEPFLPPRTLLRGNITVGIKCLTEQGREVPRYYRVHVAVEGRYVIALRDIAPGVALSEQDMQLTQGDITRLPSSVVTDLSSLMGKRSTRRIAAGTPMQPQMAKPPVLISRNSRVNVTASNTSLTATAKGVALDEASQDDMLRIRMDSGKIINGVADGPGSAHVVL